MSFFDYKQSFEISKSDPSFAAIIMAAMRKADSFNLNLLRRAFPDLYEEFKRRYNAPGGLLPTDPEYKQRGLGDEKEGLRQKD
jgi:hypothetical protein